MRLPPEICQAMRFVRNALSVDHGSHLGLTPGEVEACFPACADEVNADDDVVEAQGFTPKPSRIFWNGPELLVWFGDGSFLAVEFDTEGLSDGMAAFHSPAAAHPTATY